MAMQGLNTVQEAHLLEIEGLQYQPDLVILGYVLNDASPGSRLKSHQNISIFYRMKQIIAHSSLIHYTYKSAKRISWTFALALGLEQVENVVRQDYLSAHYTSPDRWNQVFTAFKTIDRLAQANGIQDVVVMIFPVLYNLEKYPWKAIHRQVTEAALQHHFKVLDLLQVYQQYTHHALQIDNGDNIHPNAFGHQLAANALYQFLHENALLPER